MKILGKLKKLVATGLLVVGLVGLTVSSASADFTERDITLNSFTYTYYPALKTCHLNTFKEKKNYYQLYKNDSIIVNKIYENVAGIYIWMVGSDKDGEFSMNFFNNYGECKLYETVVVNMVDNVDQNKYVNMKDPGVK